MASLTAGALVRSPAAAGAPPRSGLWPFSQASADADTFDLDPDWIHMGGLLHASHPEPVQQAIRTYRTALDRNPVHTLTGHVRQRDAEVRAAAARFLSADPHEIGLTFNTTTGLGLLYAGIDVRPGQELLTTVHDYQVTKDAIQMRTARTGATTRMVPLYDHGSRADAQEMVERLISQIRDETRVLALTWVHSGTGVKIPLARIMEGVREINAGRPARSRVLVVADAVHALGVEDFDVRSLDVDFLAAGTHKWLNGPRGTGILYGASRVHDAVTPVIPTFTRRAGWGGRMSPGGFHTFEHRWAMVEAFDLQRQLGRDAIQDHIHGLASQLKEGLGGIRGLTLYTPRDPSISSGIVCFTIAGRSPGQVVRDLRRQGIIATTTPYSPSYARLTPGLMNDATHVDRAIEAVRAVA